MEEMCAFIKAELSSLRLDISALKSEFNRRMERLEDSHWMTPDRKRSELLLFITITVSFIPFIVRLVGGVK